MGALRGWGDAPETPCWFSRERAEDRVDPGPLSALKCHGVSATSGPWSGPSWGRRAPWLRGCLLVYLVGAEGVAVGMSVGALKREGMASTVGWGGVEGVSAFPKETWPAE